jgi:hypothetical protein
MSMITCDGSVTYTEIEPLVPAGTTAALATMAPLYEFSVETLGRDTPAGHTLRNCSCPCGTTVMFNEYARALAGTPQLLCGIGTSRC